MFTRNVLLKSITFYVKPLQITWIHPPLTVTCLHDQKYIYIIYIYMIYIDALVKMARKPGKKFSRVHRGMMMIAPTSLVRQKQRTPGKEEEEARDRRKGGSKRE